MFASTSRTSGAFWSQTLIHATPFIGLLDNLLLFRLPQHPSAADHNRRQSYRDHKIQPKPPRINTSVDPVAEIEEGCTEECLQAISEPMLYLRHQSILEVLTAVKVPGKNTTVTAVITRMTALSLEAAIATCCEVSASLVLVIPMLILLAESRCAIPL